MYVCMQFEHKSTLSIAHSNLLRVSGVLYNYVCSITVGTMVVEV